MRRIVLVITLLAAGLTWAPSPAAAHAAFVASDPAPDSVVTALPEHLHIFFSQPVAHSGTSVTVTGPDGSVVSGELEIVGVTVMVPIRSVGNGVYLVVWTNVSLDDGHDSAGEFQFTLADSASGT
jgi:methionine-rich copper-binding protein CopC